LRPAAQQRIFVALDTPEVERVRELVTQLWDHVGGFKVGLELFISHGPSIVREIRDRGARVFLDLKLHDIPNTVAGAAAAAARLGVDYLTVHAGGGAAMIGAAQEAARKAAADSGVAAPTILGVTVLTSLDDAALEQIGLSGPARTAVVRLAGLVRDAGAGGLVCSPLEIRDARRAFPEGKIVVPGIRPAGAAQRADDQARVATPAQAVDHGADLLVIGRPITRADDPVAAARAIAGELEPAG
jgi:orotidine-5'-phosphate decarboxylase